MITALSKDGVTLTRDGRLLVEKSKFGLSVTVAADLKKVALNVLGYAIELVADSPIGAVAERASETSDGRQ